ncbi:VWA domain-containing protein [Candidatus Woesearchaeota archaeon]|nr:VWA domain-containing protein [Candidatus Woesearchaeota archaeon]
MQKKVRFPESSETLETDKSGKKGKVSQGEFAEELSGNLNSQNQEEKLMHSVMENDKDTIDSGKLLADSINQGLGSFMPDMMFDKITQNYTMAKQLFGETMIRQVSGYDPEYVQRNIKIPEFQRELERKIRDRIDTLKKEGYLDKDGLLSDKGLEVAALVTYAEELDKLEPKGFFGDKKQKKKSHYGITEEYRDYKKGDRYKDIAIRKTIKTAIRRGHDKVVKEDLKVFQRESKAHIYIIYAIDASGSMKGEKISLSKKAGIALAYKAINEKDKVGLIAFGTDIKEKVEPTNDFMHLLRKITSIRASAETNIKETVKEASSMFPQTEVTKHLIILTDALPTTGKDPQKEVLDEIANAKNFGITVSVVGINLDSKGEKLAEKMAEIGGGRLYVVKDIEEIDRVVLEDYYSL